MIRKILISLLYLASLSVFAATHPVSSDLLSTQQAATCNLNAVASSDPQFCNTDYPGFPKAAYCNCIATLGQSASVACSRMEYIYSAMIDRYGSLEGGCKAQTQTKYQECIDDWKCYWKYPGSTGTSSTGLCRATGVTCTQSGPPR